MFTKCQNTNTTNYYSQMFTKSKIFELLQNQTKVLKHEHKQKKYCSNKI